MTTTTLDLNAMVVFARVVEDKGFSAAARRLGISKSAVSKHIAQLEDRTGVRLLQRTTRRLALTDAGAAFYERCARIVTEVEDAERTVSQLQASPRGRLRVSGPLSFGTRHLGPVVAQFLRTYPDVQVDLQLSDRLVDLVEEGFDVAIRIARLTDSTLIARRLCAMPLLTIASPDYLSRRGTPAHPRDLAHHTCLLYSYAPQGDTWMFHHDGADVSVHVAGDLRTNNGDVILDAARAGLGVAVLPAFMVGPVIASGELTEILADFRPRGTAIYAVYPHNRHLSTKVRAFVDALVQAFASPAWDVACPAGHFAQGPDP